MLYYLSVTVWNEYKRCQPGISSFPFKAEAAKMLRKQQTIKKKLLLATKTKLITTDGKMHHFI